MSTTRTRYVEILVCAISIDVHVLLYDLIYISYM